MRIGVAGAGRIGAFHAATLAGLDQVEEVVVTDAMPEVAAGLAERAGYCRAADIDELVAAGRVDGVVIASSSDTHAALLERTVAAGLPTFCEKPLATTLDETVRLVKVVESAGVPVQVGFQRRFDGGHLAARTAVATGELGFLHTIRAGTLDPAPPPAAYVAHSGGIFRDCSVHDFDGLRFVTGREVTAVYATGANKGASFFAEAGDVATAAAILTLDDGTLATVSATRYNGAGYDVRLDVMGERGTVGVGYDDGLPMRSAEADTSFPRGPRARTFLDRFRSAYEAELVAFCEMVAGARPSPCTPRDALQAFRIAEACEISRAKLQPVMLADVGGAA